MPADTEEILDDSVEGQELLRLTCGFESSHLLFSLAGRLMRHFDAMVGVESSIVRNGG
jgi:hypothetical protein